MPAFSRSSLSPAAVVPPAASGSAGPVRVASPVPPGEDLAKGLSVVLRVDSLPVKIEWWWWWCCSASCSRGVISVWLASGSCAACSMERSTVVQLLQDILRTQNKQTNAQRKSQTSTGWQTEGRNLKGKLCNYSRPQHLSICLITTGCRLWLGLIRGSDVTIPR